jgi:AraC-like DNA-binding protein
MASSASYQRLVRARRLIDDRFGEPLDLDTLAAEARLSRFHFLRQFQREFQTTPHAYLQARRIERARHLLVSGNVSVTDVCYDVGFQSLGSFSTLFRRIVGQSPATYRARAMIVVPGFGRVGPLVFIPNCYVRLFELDRRPARLVSAHGRVAAPAPAPAASALVAPNSNFGEARPKPSAYAPSVRSFHGGDAQ